MPCAFCGAAETINNSHVVPVFVIEYLRNNSIRRAFFNTRQNQQYRNRGEFRDWMIAGPYLCQRCDNNVFGGWENDFSQAVFPNPLAATEAWGLDSSLKFIVSICYRYSIHSLEVDQNPAHQPIGQLFSDRCKDALKDLKQLGQRLFVYPYIYRPITDRCDLQPGINHLLTMTLSDRFRLAGGGLPSRYVIQLPGMTFLFSESDLNATGLPGYMNLIDLRPGSVFQPLASNLQILGLYADLMNEGIVETQYHQSATNRWNSFVYYLDRALYFRTPIYRAAKADDTLRKWQHRHC